MAWNTKRRYAPKSSSKRRKYGRSRRVTRVPRSVASTSHAVFPFSRTYVLKTAAGDPASTAGGQLNGVLSVGNVVMGGMDRFLTGTSQSSTTNATAAAMFPQQLINLSNIYTSARIIKHEITLIPICAGTAMNAVPVLVSYSKYGSDSTVAATAPKLLSSYLSNAPGSKIYAPTNERMPAISRTFYPAKGSVNDNAEFLLPTAFKDGAGTTAVGHGLLDTDSGNVEAGKTLGYFKIFASDCGGTNAAGTAFVATPVYRVIEKLTLTCHHRRAT